MFRLFWIALWLGLCLPASARIRFVLLPLDNRPCNLLFVRQIARLAQADVVAPPEHRLGSWLNPGQCDTFPAWLANNVQEGDTVVVSSDMLCYGGLVGSRNARTTEKLALERLQALAGLKERGARLEVLATIPRLSLRTSEGEAPFESALAAWAGEFSAAPDRSQYPPRIPIRWVNEYLEVRRRNLAVDLRLVQMLKDGQIDRLVVGQDDSAARGLHFLDQGQVSLKMGELASGMLLSGADELTMDMVSGRLADLYDFHPGLSVEYSEAGSENLIPPLESRPLSDMVAQHLALAGARASPGGEDVRIFVQVPADRPFGLPGEEERPRSFAFVERVREWMVQGHRAAIADVALINRMNPYLAEAVLARVPLTRLEAFAGWNTPANAFGTVVAQVVVRRIADRAALHWPIALVKESSRTHLAFLLARLIDDYGYQTLVRGEFYAKARALPGNPDPFLSPFLTLGREVRVRLIQWALQLYQEQFLGRLVELPGGRGDARLGKARLEVILPWPRLFEVEVRLDVDLTPVSAQNGTTVPPAPPP